MIEWYDYPGKEPEEDRYLCRLENGECKKMYYDYLYGWCEDYDECDRPLGLYCGYLQYTENTPANRKEWEKLKRKAEREKKKKALSNYNNCYDSTYIPDKWFDYELDYEYDYEDDPWDPEDSAVRKYKADKIHLEIIDVLPFINHGRSGFIIEWTSDIGYGEYKIYKSVGSDEWYGDSEYMDSNEDKEFIRELMKLFIDDLIIE